MKEDKENARPKERRGAPAGPGAGSGAAGGSDGRTGGTAELERLERPKDKKETLSKVVIRRLPPSLTREQLEEHLQPLPEHDYFEFFANDSSLYPHVFSRAYINFRNQEDIVLFRDRFDGYVFVDHKGQEYAAIVEFAPFQKAAKKKSKKKDAKTGTIEDDPEYKKFLESYSADDEKLTSTPETLLEEIEARNKELIAKKTTPLLNFLKNKQRLREEKREERRRRELERKRQREEERRKWKEEERRKRKEAEKLKKVDRCPEKERDRSKEEPKIKLLKKPEKDEKDLEKKEKSKKLERETLREEKNASSASAKRSDGETKEEKAKKSEDECVKDYRDRDRDFERDREYERAQREKLRRQEEERRRQKERFEKEKVFRRKEEEVKKERDLLRDKGKKSDLTDFTCGVDKSEKVTKDDKKEDTIKRDRIRNKDRPAMQLYQPGARSRSRLCQYEDSAAKSTDQGAEKKQESESSNVKEEE
ncbi:regulator of nonsense transcripts 3B [Tympanuchus pallidicinctus]|uniref:regulator of nonsense transcripts 3B n=1 Tax=Tympanuchus pallidicinctus TaxID=109042 RepID=UPI002286F363|nr:regulator of nonsense transcripts 3B [Tympanuchus pallidicinctus]